MKHDLDPIEKVALETNLAHAIDGLRLSERDRWTAAQALAKGEAISDLVCSAVDGLRAIARFVIRILVPGAPASDQTQA